MGGGDGGGVDEDGDVGIAAQSVHAGHQRRTSLASLRDSHRSHFRYVRSWSPLWVRWAQVPQRSPAGRRNGISGVQSGWNPPAIRRRARSAYGVRFGLPDRVRSGNSTGSSPPPMQSCPRAVVGVGVGVDATAGEAGGAIGGFAVGDGDGEGVDDAGDGGDWRSDSGTVRTGTLAWMTLMAGGADRPSASGGHGPPSHARTPGPPTGGRIRGG